MPDPSLRQELTEKFSAAGYQVTAVAHPRHAWEAVNVRAFDLVILEFELPEFEATEVLAKLKMMIADVQVIVLVDRAASHASQCMLDAGAACLAVDCEFEELAQLAELAIDQARSKSEQQQAFTRYPVSRRLSAYRPVNN